MSYDPNETPTIPNFNRDIGDAGKIVNQTSGVVPVRSGASIRPLPVVVAEAEASLLKVYYVFGSDAFTITARTQLGVTATGEKYQYIGAMPFNVTLATNPVNNPDFIEVVPDSEKVEQILSEGIIYDSNRVYEVNARAQWSDGVMYVSQKTQSGNDPVSNNKDNWLSLHESFSNNLYYASTEQKTFYTMSPNRHIFGEEYLWGFHKQVLDSLNTNNNKFVWSGDSTTEGSNVGIYKPDFIGALVSGDLGLAFHTHVNSGHSGEAATNWDSTYVAQDIANNADMNGYVARWGINDGSAHGNVQTYIDSMNSGLSKLRAFKSVKDLTIVVVSPNSTSDPHLGRDENWYEKIIPELRKICRKHQAVFIDIYSIWQDAKQGGGKWYDQPDTGAGPAPIHPDASLALQIGARITKMIVEPVMYGQNFAINKLKNTEFSQFMPTSAVTPSAYNKGISLWTVRQSDGWLVNGKLKATMNGAKVIQEFFQSEDDGLQTKEQGSLWFMRFGDASAGVWSKW